MPPFPVHDGQLAEPDLPMMIVGVPNSLIVVLALVIGCPTTRLHDEATVIVSVTPLILPVASVHAELLHSKLLPPLVTPVHAALCELLEFWSKNSLLHRL